MLTFIVYKNKKPNKRIYVHIPTYIDWIQYIHK
jgi:hypothetical protein